MFFYYQKIHYEFKKKDLDHRVSLWLFTIIDEKEISSSTNLYINDNQSMSLLN